MGDPVSDRTPLDPFAERLLAGLSSLPSDATDIADARAGMERDTPAVAGPPAHGRRRARRRRGGRARTALPAGARRPAARCCSCTAAAGRSAASRRTTVSAARSPTAAAPRVLSVEYRLAPEHPYPAALDDCDTAWYWLRSAADELGIDFDRVALAGDSAGGALAAGLALRLRDRREPPARLQALIYPCVDPALESASAIGVRERLPPDPREHALVLARLPRRRRADAESRPPRSSRTSPIFRRRS